MQSREITFADDESIVVFSFKTDLIPDLIAAHTQNFPKRVKNPDFDPDNPLAKDNNGKRIQPWVDYPRTEENLEAWAKSEIRREALTKTKRYRDKLRKQEVLSEADDSDLTAKILV